MISEKQLKMDLGELKRKFLEETHRLRVTIKEMKIVHKQNIETLREEHERDRERIKVQEVRIGELKSVIRKMKDEETLDEADFEEEEEVVKLPIVQSEVESVERAVVNEKDLLSRIRMEKKIMKKELVLKKFTNILSLQQYKEMERVLGFNKQTFHRIFSATNNGFLAKKFHKKCDGQYGTLLIVKTSRKKQVLGGWNPMRWNEEGSNNQWYDASGAYVFGFETEESGGEEENAEPVKKLVKFDYDGKGYAIRCNPHMGPCFGGPSTYALRISNDCQTSKSSFTKLDRSGYPNLDKGMYFLNGGKKGNFKVLDYEIFVKLN